MRREGGGGGGGGRKEEGKVSVKKTPEKKKRNAGRLKRRASSPALTSLFSTLGGGPPSGAISAVAPPATHWPGNPVSPIGLINILGPRLEQLERLDQAGHGRRRKDLDDDDTQVSGKNLGNKTSTILSEILYQKSTIVSKSITLTLLFFLSSFLLSSPSPNIITKCCLRPSFLSTTNTFVANTHSSSVVGLLLCLNE